MNLDLFGGAEKAETPRRERKKRETQSTTPPIVAIYADESCLGNGREGSNPGGAGGLVEFMDEKSGKLIRWDYWVAEPSTTNNLMALSSVIEAFGEL